MVSPRVGDRSTAASAAPEGQGVWSRLVSATDAGGNRWTASHRLQPGGFLSAYYEPLSTFASLYKSMTSSHATGLLGVSPPVIAWMAA